MASSPIKRLTLGNLEVFMINCYLDKPTHKPTPTPTQDLCLLINSHVNNTNALHILLDSLKVLPEYKDTQIIVAIGGSDIPDYILEPISDNVLYIRCPHNSIDWTGLISIIELQNDYRCYANTYYYLHDTCTAGPRFLQLLRENSTDIITTKSFVMPSMNIGFYKRAYLISMADRLLSYKNTDLSSKAALHWKALAVHSEDSLFKDSINHQFIPYGMSVLRRCDFYGNGVQRIIEYYTHMDLNKIKANYNFDPTGNYQLGL